MLIDETELSFDEWHALAGTQQIKLFSPTNYAEILYLIKNANNTIKRKRAIEYVTEIATTKLQQLFIDYIAKCWKLNDTQKGIMYQGIAFKRAEIQKRILKEPIKENKYWKQTGGSKTFISPTITIEQILKHYGIKTYNNKALCPFHNEKTPSLSYNNQKGLWKCFGDNCNSKGNTTTLMQKLENRKK